MSNFPLLKLPAVALHEVTEMMMPNEMLKMGFWESVATVSSYMCFLYVRDSLFPPKPFPLLKLPSLPLELITKLMGPHEIFKTQDNKYLDFNCFHGPEKLEIYTLISALYSAQDLEWVFQLDTVSEQSILESLDFVLSTNFTRLAIWGDQTGICCGKISAELLTEVIDKVPLTKFLDISTMIPKGFKHPSAFKFAKTRYRWARWVTIDDLCSVRNPAEIYLECTNFNSHDINRFLRYWIDCDEDMMVKLDMSATRSVWDVSVVIGGFVSIEMTSRSFYRKFLFNTKNQTNRKHNLGFLSINDSAVVFRTLSSNDGFQPELDLLRLLNQMKTLEDEMWEIRKQELSEELKRRKQEIRDELMVLERKFNEDNVEGYRFRMG